MKYCNYKLPFHSFLISANFHWLGRKLIAIARRTVARRIATWQIFNFCVAIFINFSTTYAQEAHPMEQYQTIAAENNPQLKSLFNQYLAALEEIPQVGTLPDPQLSFAVFIQPIETRVGAQRASFSVSQMFPWFGTLTAQERVAAERAKARLQQFEDAKLELFKQISITYNELYYLRKAIQITKENLDLLASFKELARVNFEGGSTGFADVLQVEMEEESLQNQLRYLEEGQQPLQVQLEQLLNEEIVTPLVFPNSLPQHVLSAPKDSIFQAILANNPRLAELQHESQAYEHQATVARKMGLPSFTLGGSYTNIAPRTDMEMANNGQDAILFPQVGIRLPLYRKKYQAMEKQAHLQQEATRFAQESRQDQLLTELEKLYRNYRDAQRRVALNRRLADLAQRTLNLVQTEFSSGEADFEEIIRLERQLLNYQLEQEKARTEQNNYVYSIHYLMGKQP